MASGLGCGQQPGGRRGAQQYSRAANAAHNRLRGLVDNLGVRRPWRKRGLGRALLVASLRGLRERGQTEVALGVDAENLSGALRLYESVGFRPIDHGMVMTKALE